MISSLRLLLEDFLGLMKEEGELDIYLPLLLSAMGHEVLFRAQKGTRQYGVDISSVGKDDDGRKKLFLWLVKCGDINRSDWDSGEQSIRQSINDVGDTYLPTHVPPQHARLPKKLVVLTNGDFKANLNLTIATYLTTWSAQQKVEADIVNGSTLAAWTERYLLDENVLPPAYRTLLRRMLANVGSPELSISVGQTLVRDLVRSAKKPGDSAGARRKRLLTALRGVRTALSVLQVWAQNEKNLVAPYRLAEFSVLCVWAELNEDLQRGNKDAAREFAELLFQLAAIAEVYHERMQPYYLTQDAFANALPDSLLVSDAVFRELGRLGFQGGIWAANAVQTTNPIAERLASVYVNRLVALLKSHTCTQSPAYDHHALDIHAALLLLLNCDRRDDARQWLAHIAGRLPFAARAGKYWPSTVSFEQTLLTRHGYEESSDELSSVSTLVPIVLVWAAVLNLRDVYSHVRDTLIPAIPKTTLNMWSSDVGFDTLVADPVGLHKHGVGESMQNVPAEPAEFLALLTTPLAGVESIEQSAWYQFRAAYIPLLAALHWRLQVPREMLVRQAIAVSTPLR